jgi:hypothetical protein
LFLKGGLECALRVGTKWKEQIKLSAVKHNLTVDAIETEANSIMDCMQIPERCANIVALQVLKLQGQHMTAPFIIQVDQNVPRSDKLATRYAGHAD